MKALQISGNELEPDRNSAMWIDLKIKLTFVLKCRRMMM